MQHTGEYAPFCQILPASDAQAWPCSSTAHTMRGKFQHLCCSRRACRSPVKKPCCLAQVRLYTLKLLLRLAQKRTCECEVWACTEEDLRV